MKISPFFNAFSHILVFVFMLLYNKRVEKLIKKLKLILKKQNEEILSLRQQIEGFDEKPSINDIDKDIDAIEEPE